MWNYSKKYQSFNLKEKLSVISENNFNLLKLTEKELGDI